MTETKPFTRIPFAKAVSDSVTWAHADFAADVAPRFQFGAQVAADEIGKLTRMAEIAVKAVREIAALAGELEGSVTGEPENPIGWLQSVIIDEAIADFFRLTPAAAGVLSAAAEAAQ